MTVTSPKPATRPVRAGLALALLCSAQFMLILDTTIVNVALPSIRADLGFTSQAALQSVISLYALTFGGFLIVAGRAADLFGRRRMFTAGLLLFAGASTGGTAAERLVAGFATGYLVDATLAALGLVLALTLVRARPGRR